MQRASTAQTPSRLSESKARVNAIRNRARQAHGSGVPAWNVVTNLAGETEKVIVDFFRDMLDGLNVTQRRKIEQNTAVVKVGGFGRGELAPYSDVDLMFLHRGTIGITQTDALGRVVRDCWDAGIKLGQTVQTMRDAVRLARTDITFATAAVESTLLCGDAQLLNDFRQLFRRKVVDSRIQAFVDDCISTRRVERKQYGGTVSQIQPNIKRSPGGLRDLHLIRWIGFTRYQTSEIDDLHKVWALTEDDVQILREAREFLTRLRCEMHFHAEQSQDVLTREEQLRLAANLGYEASPGRQPVERFMQDYFRYASAIDEVAERLSAMEKPRAISTRIVNSILPSRTEDIFLIAGDQIEVQAGRDDELCCDLNLQIRLFALSARHSVPPAPQLLREIAESTATDSGELSESGAEDFLEIMNSIGAIGATLRLMYKAGVLEKIIPEMTRARGLLEFNEYHQFTVDEHSFRAVEAAENFHEEASLLGQAYGEVRRKHLLHLALLLHDMGKGYEEDHSVVGGRIAGDVADRLGLKPSHRERLIFLVENHLIMSHLAFRRNLSDLDVILPFTRDVGSLDLLKMLYVLTSADITAVGPGIWNDWKGGLLAELYERSQLLLSGIRHDVEFHERLKQLRQRVRSFIESSALLSAKIPDANWLDQTLDTLPDHYLSANNVEQIAEDLLELTKLQADDAIVDGNIDLTSGTILCRIITHDVVAKGCFSKMAGVMSALGLEIVFAEICTTSAGIVIDKFRLVDLEHPEDTPEVRLEEIQTIIRDVLAGRRKVESLFSRRRQTADTTVIGPVRSPRIVFDNNSSHNCTIIDIFAGNRHGLLYTIAGALVELDLSVQLAKISTYGNMVVDVFYVTCSDGNKLEDAERLKIVEETLKQRVEAFIRLGLHSFASTC